MVVSHIEMLPVSRTWGHISEHAQAEPWPWHAVAIFLWEMIPIADRFSSHA